MSGASALASARRRRAGAEPPSLNQPTRQQSTNIPQQTDTNNDQKYTPLQILQIHETKIKTLEETLEETLDEKILAVINKTIDDKLEAYQSKNISNDSNIVNEEMNSKIETLLSNKLVGVNDTIKSILINIEKLSNLSVFNEKATNKIDELINEMNGLKMLVIKNQTLSLEINGEMIKMKNTIKDIESNVQEIKSSNNTDNNENMFDMNGDATHILLKSMMESQMNINSDPFSKINIHEDEENIEEEDDFSENIEQIQITDQMKNEIIDELSELSEISEISEIKDVTSESCNIESST